MSIGVARVLVVGVGNAARGDDAAGLLVAQHARPLLAPLEAAGRVVVATLDGELLPLLDLWRGAQAVVVADAVTTGAPPGEVTRFDLTAGPLPASLRFASTHAFSVAGAVELGRALGRLPDRVILYGIEGRSFDYGATVSAVVAGAAAAAAAVVAAEVAALLTPRRAA
ncbi:MAG: hydrogenase maturation protease [Armatimonadota bacterium]|nr:hydrogenase maturation protease [Armatimonadota bacterium]